jgi:hypothetical protein
MSEPLVTPVAMYTLGGTVAAGHFLGVKMSIESDTRRF